MLIVWMDQAERTEKQPVRLMSWATECFFKPTLAIASRRECKPQIIVAEEHYQKHDHSAKTFFDLTII